MMGVFLLPGLLLSIPSSFPQDKVLDCDILKRLMLAYAVENEFFKIKHFTEYVKGLGFGRYHRRDDLCFSEIKSQTFINTITLMSKWGFIEKYNQRQWHSLVYGDDPCQNCPKLFERPFCGHGDCFLKGVKK